MNSIDDLGDKTPQPVRGEHDRHASRRNGRPQVSDTLRPVLGTPRPPDAQAASALQAERDRLAQIVEALPVGVVLMDAAGQVLLENQLTRDLFQRADRPAPGLDGRLSGTLSRSDGSPYELRDVPIARSLQGEEVRAELVRYTRADGRQFDLLTNSSTLRGPSGEIVGAVAAYEDVTAMSETQRERTAFFAMASHELKTPLTAVQGQIQLARRFHERGASDLAASALSRADDQVQRLTSLIDDLLDAARLDAGRFDVTLVSTDIADALGESVGRLRAVAGSRQIRVVLPDSVLLVLADERRLGQVLDNVIMNALRHGGSGDIVVALDAEDHQAVVRVRDHGGGIAEKDRQRIFERFYRTDAARTTPGTGLGLSVARAIARLHRGDLTLESTGPTGSVFRLSIPISAAS